jgi:hypothetical protein
MKARPEATEHSTRRPSLRLLLLTPAVALAGCAPFSVGTMHEPGFAPASGVTYAWREGSLPGEEYPMLRGEHVIRTIRAAVDTELARVGLRQVSGPAVDYFIDFHLSAREESEVITEFHADTGWDEPVGTIEYTASMLLVDLVTATGDTVVWRGWATGELAESSSAWVEDRIREAVEKMFEGFPVRPPSSPPMR